MMFLNSHRLLPGICLALLCSFTAFAQMQAVVQPNPPGINVNTARMNDLKIDAGGNKWIAFGNFGLGMFDGSAWTMYDSSGFSLPSDSAICLEFENSGTLWIGTKAGAVRKNGSAFTTFNTGNSSLPSNIVTALNHSGNTTWFGTYNGLAAYDGATWLVYQTSNSGLPNDSVTCLVTDANGVLWAGTRNGLARFDGVNWTAYNTSNSALDRYIFSLACDNLNRIWISDGYYNTGLKLVTITGYHFLQNGNVLDFETDFYHYEYPLTYPSNTAIHTDASGEAWFRATAVVAGYFNTVPAGFRFLNLPAINGGVQSFGSLNAVDANGDIWTVSRYRFYFYKLTASQYQVPLELFNFYNYRTLNINDVDAAFNVCGDMHWDLNNAHYYVPKSTGKQSVFSSAFWIGGYDHAGDLHVAAQTYRQTGIDYWPGPIGSLATPFDSSTCIAMNKIWKMDKWKIEEFKNQFAAGNVGNGTYTIPDEIATWPAKGNGLVSGTLAPFVDANSDGNYQPLDGDYPLIKGDQMLFYVFNDSLGAHTATGAPKLGIEVHVSVYAFQCAPAPDSEIVLNRTQYYHYDIINRSTADYDSVHAGFFSDMDIGNAIDDIIGCDTLRAAGFTYNGDNDDETASGYGFNPPMQNIKILRGTLAKPGDGIDNDLDGIIDEPGERTSMNSFMTFDNVNNIPTGNPAAGMDFYNYLRAIWQDGSHATYGGSGYNSSGTFTNFLFPGTPFDPLQWNQTGTGLPYDARIVIGTGPFQLNAGDTATLDFAYVFTWEPNQPNGISTSIARNRADLDRVQQWFDQQTFPSCENYVTAVPFHPSGSGLHIMPNPVQQSLHFSADGLPAGNVNYEIMDALGNVVQSGSVTTGHIPVTRLTPQLYILRIVSESRSYQSRFVKM